MSLISLIYPANIVLMGALLVTGCSAPSEPDHQKANLEKALETQLEVLHQTREVLRYTDEQRQLEYQRLEEVESHPPDWQSSAQPALPMTAD